jgi:hypothetical protein
MDFPPQRQTKFSLAQAGDASVHRAKYCAFEVVMFEVASPRHAVQTGPWQYTSLNEHCPCLVKRSLPDKESAQFVAQGWDD